jgi:type III pantothenate kinase
MILAVDIGNSRTHAALFDGERLVKSLKRLDPSGAQICCFASVVPRAERALKKLSIPLYKIGRDLKVPLKSPAGVGADRLCNALAAWCKTGRTTLVIDAGSAVTFDIVSRGEFLGGVIAPGPSISAQALTQCALLPLVKPAKVRRVIGRKTREAIQSGLLLALEGLIRRGIKEVERELGRQPVVIGTGGALDLIRDKKIFDEIDPYLTLRGVALTWLMRPSSA